MKKTKSLLALLLALLMALSFVGCHGQNEIAIEVEDVDFTSAMYSYALLEADMEAKDIVDQALGEDKALTEYSQYLTQTVENTPYVQWVENRAKEKIREFAAYDILCRQNNLTLTDDEIASAKSYGEYYYSYNKALYEANGIGEQTFIKMQELSYKSDAYFKFLYGDKGSKAVPMDEVKEYFEKTYRVAVIFEKDITDLKDAELNKANDEIDKYAKKLKGAKKEDIVKYYNEFYGLTEANAATTGYSPAKEIRECVSLIADPKVDANYGQDFWNDIKGLKAGQTKVLTNEVKEDKTTGTAASKTIRLIYIVESVEDDTYLKDMDMSIRYTLKQEEFSADVLKYALTLSLVEHKDAMSPFKVDKIKYDVQ